MADSRAAALPTSKPKRKWKLFSFANSFDMPFFIILMIVLVVGLVCLYSASYAYSYYQNNGDSYFYIKRQIIFAGIGIAVMFVASIVDYHIFHKLAIILMVISLILLVIVRIMPAPTGVHRWLPLPVVGQFQPSEVAKFSMIVLFAHLISINYKKMKTFTIGFLPFILILGVTCGLVFVEPHLSGTILLLCIGLIMMYVGGTRFGYLLAVILLGVAAVVYMVFFKGYEAERIQVWRDPMAVYTSSKMFDGMTGRDAAWQTVQSLYAIGSGGIMGQGLGNSRQKHLFLPEPQNDFIFSVICEELGLIGAILVIVLFGLLVWRGFMIGMKAKDKFGSLLAIGLTAQIGIQAALNMAVVTNTIPNTGISLPFFSYGGTSLIMLLAQMGVVLSVSRQVKMEKS